MATLKQFYEAQLLIDEEIADLTPRVQREISLLKSQTGRNELAPVSKLPDEIIVRIFLIFRDSTDLRPKNWLQVTHICRYWRDVAVGSPLLWTRLHNPPQKIAGLMLGRSQSAPLDVSFVGGPKNSNETLAIILHQIERIQNISLQSIPQNLMDSAQTTLASLGREASLLEKLQVAVSGAEHATLKFDLNVFRPNQLFRLLSFSGLKYDWNILPLPNITYLNLSGQISGEVSGAQFTEALRQMPNLESLSINCLGIVPRGQHTPITHPQPIHLPRLVYLDIYNTDQTRIEWLFRQMTHPRLQKLSLDSSLSIENNVEMRRLVTHLIKKGDFSSLRSLKIYADHFTLSAHPGKFEHKGVYIDIDVQIGGFSRTSETDFTAVSSVLSCITPFDSSNILPLQYLYLAKLLIISLDEFSRLFAYLPHLELIKVDQKFAFILFKVLGTTPAFDALTTNSNTPIPFPKLQSIIWCGEQLSRRRVPMLSAAVFSDLYRGLISRHGRGAPITKLELVNCERLDEIQTNQLKEIGLEVIVR